MLVIKESYLLTKNIFGLGVHPFKTLREVLVEKDRSQQLLLFLLPVYVLTAGTGMVWLGRRWLGRTAEWGLAAKTTALGVMGVTTAIGIYLAYWCLKARRARYE